MAIKKSGSTLRRPSEVYQSCPACGDTELVRMNVDVLCGSCDWNSIESFVDAGGMDNVFTAYFDHFSQHPENCNEDAENLSPVLRVDSLAEMTLSESSDDALSA